ncbi:MAG: high-affinity branched-chain amino acid ABC transporter permease LivM [Burkholderiales bacterium]|nr:high-affinity branched-chain amino acid ABC transporter permease LivM [Burkholderiales bacterium]
MRAARAGRPPFDLPGALKDAGIVAGIVVLLGVALVGARVEDASIGPPLRFRIDDVVAAAVIAFVGRLGIAALRAQRALPVLVAALAFAAVLTGILLHGAVVDGAGLPRRVLPFASPVVNWTLAVAAWALSARAAWLVWHAASPPGSEAREAREARMDRLGARIQHWARFVGPLLLGVAVVLPFLPGIDRRMLDIAILVATYVMLGWGLNIVVGLAGLLDLGYVAFYAVGAYSYALLALYFDLGFWVCLPFAGIMAAFAGILLGFPVLRLRGDYLAIVTLGFGEIIRIILLNWYTFTKGPDGLSGIPRPTFFGLPFTAAPDEGEATFHSFFGLEYSPLDRIVFLYYLILGLALVTNLFTLRIRKLPVGRAWEALREDEIACRSLGVHPRNTKLTAFAIGAMFAGFGGSFFATRQGFISPESFTFIESAIILSIVVLGGMGSQIGIVFAAILLIGLPEVFRELNQYRMLAFGLAMVAIMVWRPRGLLAHREPTLRLAARAPGVGEAGRETRA